MIKKVFLSILLLCLVVAALAGVKVLQIQKMIAQGESFVMPPAVISTANATAATWETVYRAIGSVTAIQGVTVTAETPGKIVSIGFDSGHRVKAGDVLVQQDVSQENAQLRALEASEQLARANLKRLETLLAHRATSESDYDVALADHRRILAEMDALKAAIVKKTIRAPFAGVLGLRQANLGQNLGDSTPIVVLQRLDQVHVEFTLPQQQMVRIPLGAEVRVGGDVLGEQVVTGRLSAVEPLADPGTRSVRLQAVLDNPGEKLLPGMFVNVDVALPEKQDVILIPATAVLYAAYSDSVFVVDAAEDPQHGLVLRQQFVTLGERRGDYVVVNRGLEVGQTVVSAGVFKYRNGQSVVVDNTLSPDFSLSPTPENS